MLTFYLFCIFLLYTQQDTNKEISCQCTHSSMFRYEDMDYWSKDSDENNKKQTKTVKLGCVPFRQNFWFEIPETFLVKWKGLFCVPVFPTCNLIGKSKMLMAQEANKVGVSLPLLSHIVENFPKRS